MNRVKIGDRFIGQEEPVFIIAEAGVNHNGDINMAKELIDIAKEAGADAVKFQTFKTENIILPSAPKAAYHIETTGNEQSWFDLLKSQELSESDHQQLINYCENKGIMFLSTAYDKESVDLLDELGIAAFKVASTDANNIDLLRCMAKKERPILLSTAMCALEEVKESVEAIKEQGNNDIVLFHCTANYPAKLEDSNLKAMITLQKEFNILVGYSDHVSGYINPIAAVAMGAVSYEKHFTLDKNLPGPDHRASLDPDELKRLVSDIRSTEVALGRAEKRALNCEQENRKKLRKSVVTSCDIDAGAMVDASMFCAKRPGTGLSPKHIDLIAGKKTKVSLKKDTIVNLDHFE